MKRRFAERSFVQRSSDLRDILRFKRVTARAEKIQRLSVHEEDGQQDGSTIDIDNNIVNHLIAECQNCHGIFISAMIASDQPVESINGVCPLCNKDTEQFLKWIVKDYPEEE